MRSFPFLPATTLCPRLRWGDRMRIIDLLCSLPLWLIAVVLNVVLMGIALIGLRLVRRWVVPGMRLCYEDAYFAAAVVQSAMLLYGLVAALTAVGVWERFNEASETASAEAMAIASLWRDLGGYPPPVRDKAHDFLRGYTEQIIMQDWPEQRRGIVPRSGMVWMDQLQAHLFTFEPTSESQKILHAETLRAYNQLVQWRRERLEAVKGQLPGVLWCVLLPGAMACIVICLFFHAEDLRLHSILLVGLAGFLAMVLFVIVALDRPFRGATRVTTESYQIAYDQLMKKR